MAKKNKASLPNAPEFQQVLLESSSARQPPRNPYYPDINSETHLPPPPPYSDLSEASNQNAPACKQYQKMSGASGPRTIIPTVVVQHHPAVSYSVRRDEKHHRSIRQFNKYLLISMLIAICMSVFAYSLYSRRPCVGGFLVHKPTKDVSITISDIKDGHLEIAYGSIFILLICLAKSVCGDCSSYSCYLMFMGIVTFLGTIVSGYLAYLAFYSPCTIDASQLVSSFIKTAMGQVFDKVSSPDQGNFAEANVFKFIEQDREGSVIFLFDLFVFILYLCGFLMTAVQACC